MHDENKKRLEPKTVRRPHFFSAALGAHKNDSGFLGVGLGGSFIEGLFFEYFFLSLGFWGAFRFFSFFESFFKMIFRFLGFQGF